MGAELLGQRTDEVHYQLTQRADFFEEEVGLETTLKRPIINTRDEPHADARKYRRLHVIVGDANPSQVATFLKVGTTALVLAMVEDDLIPHDFEFASPVASMRHVSHDLTLREGLPLADGSTITALEVQWELLDLAKEYVDRHGTTRQAARLPMRSCAAGSTCWPASNATPWSSPTSSTGSPNSDSSRAYRNGTASRSDAKLRAMDIQYTDMRPDKGLAWRVGLEQLVSDAEAIAHQRAARRHPCLFPRALHRHVPRAGRRCQLGLLVFDVGSDALRRVPMMEPMRGTRAHVGTLFDECESAAELLGGSGPDRATRRRHGRT